MVKVIAISGEHGDPVLGDIVRLEKPFSFTELTQTVRQVLSERTEMAVSTIL